MKKQTVLPFLVAVLVLSLACQTLTNPGSQASPTPPILFSTPETPTSQTGPAQLAGLTYATTMREPIPINSGRSAVTAKPWSLPKTATPTSPPMALRPPISISTVNARGFSIMKRRKQNRLIAQAPTTPIFSNLMKSQDGQQVSRIPCSCSSKNPSA